MNELSYSSLPSSRSRSRSRLDVAAQLNNQRPEHKSEVEQHRIAIQALQQQLAQMEANIRVETDEKQSKNEKTRILEAAQLDNEIQRLKHRIRRENEKEARDKYEANLKAKWEFERAEKAKKLQEEEDIKTELAKEVIRKYEIDLKEKAEQERKRKEQWECEYRAKLQNDLLAAGVDEKDIKAVLDGSKVSTKIAEEEKERKIKLKETQQAALVCVHKQDIPKPYQEIYSHSPQSLSIHEQLLSHHTPLESNQVIRPTYTRMSRRHIEIETLDYYGIKYEFEVSPFCTLVCSYSSISRLSSLELMVFSSINMMFLDLGWWACHNQAMDSPVGARVPLGSHKGNSWSKNAALQRFKSYFYKGGPSASPSPPFTSWTWATGGAEKITQ